MSSLKDIKYKYGRLDVFGKIIVINSIVFLFDVLISSLAKFGIVGYFELPANFIKFIVQPWSLITYGFLHADLWHLLFNMLFLFYLSRTANNVFRTKMVLNIYFLGIIFGGLAFLAVTNLIPGDIFSTKNGIMVGASAGISALLMFIAIYMPKAEIRLFNTFNLKWIHIAIFFVVIDVLRLAQGINQGGYIAHIGGYLLGYYYASQLKKGKDIGVGFEGAMDSVMHWFKPKSKLKTVHRTSKKKAYAGKTKDEFHTFNDQKKVDLILDKISKSGYDSLTSEEKEYLFRAGKN